MCMLFRARFPTTPTRTYLYKTKGVIIVKENIFEEKSITKGFYFICFGTFFVMLSLATHLPAYPHMLASFDLGPGHAVWMQLGLALGITGFQPLLGWVGDAFSIKVVILLGATFMALGSVLVALSPAFWVLVVGLFFKGMAGAAIAPSGVAYAGKFFTGEKRGKTLGLFIAFSTIGALFGPVLSGIFVDTLGWTSSFWFTAVLGGVAFSLFFLGVPNIKMETKRSFDFLGVVFVLVVLVGLLTIPTFINNYGFTSGMWLPSFAVFAIGLIILIVVEKKQKEPLLDLDYVANRNFWVPTVVAVLVLVGFAGVMYLLTFFVQNVQGKSATTVGVLQMAIFLGASGAAIFSGRIIKRFSARVMLGTGIVTFIAGLVMLTMVKIDASFTYLFIAMSLIGMGSGFNNPVIKAIVVSKATSSRMNVITFTNTVIENVAQRLGASFALVGFAIFAAKGDGVNALANTSLIFIALAVVALLFLVLIPKKIEGIHGVEEGVEVVQEVSGSPISIVKKESIQL